MKQPTEQEIQLRQQLVDYARRLNSSGLSVGKSGNLSARCDATILITPSGVAYESLTAEDIVAISLDGKPYPQQRYKPSSEWHFHCDLYRQRADIYAIVHAHANACTALACMGQGIPAFHYMVAIAGGTHIPIADYALFGTEALSHNICQAIGNLNACLLANHGMLALGPTIASAFNLAIEVETLAEQYSRALQLENAQQGKINILSEEQMRAVVEQFRGYGQRQH